MRLTIHAAAAVGMGVSIVACTNRPHFIDNLLANYRSQRHEPKELILIVNKDSANLAAIRRKAARHRNVSVYRIPERVSLGRCLNAGVAKAKYPIFAKFDDDDYYSPSYLSNAVRALRRTGAHVVGKRSYLTYLEAKQMLVMRFPFRHNRYVGIVAGGTITFRKNVFRRVQFRNVSLGEDVRFLRDCRLKGFKIFATDPYHYVSIRRKDKKSHTWQAGDRYILGGSKLVAVTKNFKRIANRG